MPALPVCTSLCLIVSKNLGKGQNFLILGVGVPPAPLPNSALRCESCRAWVPALRHLLRERALVLRRRGGQYIRGERHLSSREQRVRGTLWYMAGGLSKYRSARFTAELCQRVICEYEPPVTCRGRGVVVQCKTRHSCSEDSVPLTYDAAKGCSSSRLLL